ncbi:MAG: TolC family protein [Prevotellaceae bacterium]|jgi:outer membrane protein TolC|nr:TolC family protein [Prevotellaceae bacterium]
MKKISLFTVCFFTVCFSTIKAQVYHLSLEESLEIAKEKSFEIQNLQLDQAIALNELKAETARLKTSVNMLFTLPQYTETVREWEDSEGISFFSVKTLRGTGNLNILQPLPTDGLISVSTGLSSVNDYNTDKRAATFNTRIGLSQPLNSLWGYNAIRSDLKRANLNWERANKALKRAELNLYYDVSKSFYSLMLLQKGAEISLMNLERQTEAYEISKNKFEAGLIREVENLQMEVDLAEAQNSYDVTALELVSSTNSFKRLIGLELDATVTLKSETDEWVVIRVNPDLAVEMAIANRLEIKDREIQIELQKLQISRQKSYGLPQASLEASWERIGISNIGLSESYSNSISNSWNDLTARPSSYQIGITLRIPILDWGRNRSLVRAAQARQQQYLLGKEDDERGIEVEVRNLVSNIQTTVTRLTLLEKNLSVAERSYGITLQRYTDGDIDSQALSLERTRLNTAQRNHLDAFVSYRLLLADLMRKTFYDFEHNLPIE